MKRLMMFIVLMLISVSAFAMGGGPTCHSSDITACDAKYGTFLAPNYQYKFQCSPSSCQAWVGNTYTNPLAPFNYALDVNGNKIPNPVGMTSFRLVNGQQTLFCNDTPITEYGVMCYDPSKISYNEPLHTQCLRNAHCA